MWTDFHQDARHWKQMCYRTRKYSVCRCVHASFSPENVQAGAVKGLKWIRLFTCDAVSPPQSQDLHGWLCFNYQLAPMGQGFMGQLLKLMPLPAAKRVGVQTKGPFPLSVTNHINQCSSPPCAFHLWLSMYTNTWLAGPTGLRSWPAWWLGLGCLSFPFGSLLLTSQKTPWSQNRAVFTCYLGHRPHVQQEWRPAAHHRKWFAWSVRTMSQTCDSTWS